VTIETGVSFTLQYQVINWTEINNGELIFGNGDGNVNNSNGDTTIQ
jgi:hypothetical protein